MLRAALPRLFQISKMRPHHAPVLFTVVAVFSCRPLATMADAPRTTTLYQSDDDCPYYGCPLRPQDVHYTSAAMKQAFEQMRSLKRIDVQKLALRFAESGRLDAATFTLIGYKGGPLTQQINQDRALVISPFYLLSPEEAQTIDPSHPLRAERRLLGVFDGHGIRGEIVSEYAATELPRVLASKLKEALSYTKNIDEEVEATRSMLKETFIQLDREAPADPSGGSTATIVLQQGSKVFVANAGDSRSFLVTYRPSTGQAHVVYISREDKPSLPDEKARVERMGGQVYIPVLGSSRVVYHDPRSGVPTGLAMSRSIGDWAAGKLGVIPDPIVNVFDIQKLVADELNAQVQGGAMSYVVDAMGSWTGAYRRSAATTKAEAPIVDDVHIFAVAATDGMMDFVAAEEIARVLSQSLFEPDGVHPVTACEQLIFAAANSWQESKQGRYRDDIALAVSTLRMPPTNENS